MKKLLILLLALSLLLAGCASAGGEEKQTEQKEPLTAAEFVSAATDILSNSSKLTAVGDDYIINMMEISTSLATEYTVMLQTAGTEADMFGIFVCENDDGAKQIEGEINKYLAALADSWSDFNYLPTESAKLEKAKVGRSGSYVFFCVASEEEAENLLQYFNDNT